MDKILILDDDCDILEALRLILEDEGYIIRTALYGKELYSILQNWVPNLIMLYVFLSGEDGRDIVTTIKNQNEFKNVPIVMFSAQSNLEEEAKALGASAFMPKPFDIKTLLEIIRMYKI